MSQNENNQITAEEIGVKYSEFTISVTASNKLNLGDYSSAERDLSLSRKVLIPAGVAEPDAFIILQSETRKLQFMVEAQLAAIVVHTMAEIEKSSGGGYAATWKKLGSSAWTGFANKARKLFGLPTMEEEKAAKDAAAAAAKDA